MLLFTGSRRKRLKEAPFPPDWQRILDGTVYFYGKLPEEDRRELNGHIQVFVAEKSFEGVRGLTVTDEVRVKVAAHACLLLLHRETDYFPGLSSIVVYPGEFVARFHDADDAGIVTEGEDLRSGESWAQGTLVLSWEDVLLGGSEGYEDYDVILHEFAHQLDLEAGVTGGEPLLGRRRRRLWEGVLEAEYQRLQADDAAGRATFFDPYGAESPAEFFAVVTEAFFMVPVPFREAHPELYDELVVFFRQDPVSWPGSAQRA